MSRSGLAWVVLVFGVTVLADLPAAWLARAFGLPLHDVSGSLWHGQAHQWGAVGPLHWTVQPWRLQAHARLGFQGQAWQLRAQGTAWRWHVEATAAGTQRTAPAAFRLAGQWHGAVQMHGSWRTCRSAQGRITVADLAVSQPWSLALGQGEFEMDCRNGWRLLGQLTQQGQHQISLDADVPGRRAQVAVELQPDAALTPLLRGAQWLGPQATAGQREVRW
ncbi:hypothetical protein D3C79_304280 [compost metagenome]